MIKNDIAYRQLKSRRDVIKFIYDMRCFEQITSTMKKEDHLRMNNWLQYLREVDSWSIRLRAFIDGAKEGYVNLNVLDEYGDDLIKRLRDLEKNAFSEEKDTIEEIHHMQREITYLEACCPNIETLVAELLKFRMTLSVRPIEDEELDSIIEEMITLLAYDPKSAEYRILMNETLNPRWFEAYFLRKKSIPLEEHQKNMNLFLSKMLDENGPYRERVMSGALPTYIGKSLLVEEDILQRLIECNKFRFRELANIALVTLRNKGAILPFNSDEYLASKIEEFKHPKQSPLHLKGSDSPIYLKDYVPQSYTPKQIGEELKAVVEPLMCLYDPEEFLSILANRITTLDGHLEIASTISTYLQDEYPAFARTFDSAYLEATENITIVRNKLILTLNEIKKSK